MTEKHFLLKVLGLSGIPRIFSFLFTLFSFPLMLSHVGASEYGIIVYVVSIISVFESFADFGVSSAAGKELANTRVYRPSFIKREIIIWAKFQTYVALMGFVPMILATFILIFINKEFVIDSKIVYLSIGAAWITIITNFIRAILTSTLFFRSLAILDTIESFTRSFSFLFVAFFIPNAFGLAIASLAVALIISISAIVTLTISLRKYTNDKLYEESSEKELQPNRKKMLKESLNFLWLRLATRCFLAVPIFILGRQFNSNVVGIVGTVQRMVDLLTFPFAVIGNALAVRGREMVRLGSQAVNSFWNTIFRILSLAITQWSLIFICIEWFSTMLFSKEQADSIILSILSLTVITTSVSTLINPITDYAGELKKRNILLTLISIMQAPIIWIGAYTFGVVGAITAYLFVLFIINSGYLYIALISFFPSKRYKVQPEIINFLILNLLFIGIIIITKNILTALGILRLNQLQLSISSAVIFCTAIFASIILNKRMRRLYITKYFFEFHPANAK